MQSIRPLLVLPLVAGLVFALPAVAAPAKPKARHNGAVRHQLRAKPKHHHHGISGRVLHVHHSTVNKGSGTIKLLVHPRIHHKNAVVRAAINAGLRLRSHHVRIHFHPATRFNVVGKGVVGKPQTATVGKGKLKAKVVVGVKAQVKTLRIPTVSGSVHPGQWVHVKFPDLLAKATHHASTVNIHWLKSLPMLPQKGNAKGAAKKAVN
jgi:hypothetical protein